MQHLSSEQFIEAADFVKTPEGQAVGAPFYLYDEQAIVDRAREFYQTMNRVDNYAGNFFAVKCNWNYEILRILAEAGMGFDCANANELRAVRAAGVDYAQLTFTASNVPVGEHLLAASMGARINFGKPTDWRRFKSEWSGENLPDNLGVRVNPGPLKSVEPGATKVIGEHYGMSPRDAEQVLTEMRDSGVEQLGLHMMVGSNVLDAVYLAENFEIIASLIGRLRERGMEINTANVGGGLGVPYTDQHTPIDLESVATSLNNSLGSLGAEIVSEYGRYIVAESGYLVLECTDDIWANEDDMLTLPVNGSVNNASRFTTVANARHPVRFIARDGREDIGADVEVGLAGSQCTLSDRYLRGTTVPSLARPNDLVVVGVAGGHMRTNGSNYNLRGRAGELLLATDGSLHPISAGETFEYLTANQITRRS